MRIAWFTPLGPRSAIGSFSEAVAGRLVADGHDVHVYVCDAETPADCRPTDLPHTLVGGRIEDAAAAARGADAAVYNLGNNRRNHAAAWEVCRRAPGVVVLHDLVLRHFLADYLAGSDFRSRFREFFEYAHGPQSLGLANDFLAGRLTGLERHEYLRYPSFAPFLHHATAVVAHSEYARAALAAELAVPVRKLDFPLFGPHVGVTPPEPADRDPGGPVRLLSFGVLHPNKMFDAVLEAIGADAGLARRVRYTVVGEGDPGYAAHLRRLVAENGLHASVELAGYLDDDELLARLHACDAVVNLRNPHMGESSASLLDALVAGKPTVVWDHGFYGEFPDDVVVKIRSTRELRPALRRLAEDAPGRRALGERARAHALGRFRTDRYCAGLLEVIADAAARRFDRHLLGRLSAEARLWDAHPDDPTAARLADAIDSLLPDEPGVAAEAGVRRAA